MRHLIAVSKPSPNPVKVSFLQAAQELVEARHLYRLAERGCDPDHDPLSYEAYIAAGDHLTHCEEQFQRAKSLLAAA